MSPAISQRIHYSQQRKSIVLLSLLLIVLLVTVLWGLLLGPASSLTQSFEHLFHESSDLIKNLIWHVRFPRVLLAVLSGGALAISGVALQSLFNNPLADSGLIGISSGAMIGVLVAILFGKILTPFTSLLVVYPNLHLPFFAFLGSCSLAFLVYRLSQREGKVNVAMMLLSGVAINALAGALAGLMISVADDVQLRTVTFWSMGSLNGASWSINLFLFIMISMASFFLARLSHELDAISLGEKEALSMGIDTDRLKTRVLILTSLICGPVISFVGLIGFVGLVVPHILRLFIGPKSKWLMLCSFVLGAIFLTMADIVSKNAAAPSELPIGVLTALIGAPVFMYLLMKHKEGRHD